MSIAHSIAQACINAPIFVQIQAGRERLPVRNAQQALRELGRYDGIYVFHGDEEAGIQRSATVYPDRTTTLNDGGRDGTWYNDQKLSTVRDLTDWLMGGDYLPVLPSDPDEAPVAATPPTETPKRTRSSRPRKEVDPDAGLDNNLS